MHKTIILAVKRICAVKAIITIFFLAISTISFGQLGGERSYTFLEIPSSARSAAMGGSSSGIKDADINLINDNPANLDTSIDNHLSINYVNFVSDINAGNFAYARKAGKGTIGVTAQFLGYGKFEVVEANGIKTGEEFNAGDFALNIGYGRALDSLFSIGAAIKTVYSNYYYNQSVAIGIDLGAAYISKSKYLTSTIALRNIGRSINKSSNQSRNKLPTNVEIGAAIKIPKAPLRFFTQYNNIQKWDLGSNDPNYIAKEKIDAKTGVSTLRKFSSDNLFRHLVLGADIVASDNFSLTFAYNFRRRKELAAIYRGGLSGISFGAMIKVKKLQFNYSLSSYHTAGISHHIGITSNLNALF